MNAQRASQAYSEPSVNVWPELLNVVFQKLRRDK